MRITSSILNADLADLAGEVAKVPSSDMIHFDVMDNHFVPNLTLGLPVVESLRKHTTTPIDAHLMIEDADTWAPQYAEVRDCTDPGLPLRCPLSSPEFGDLRPSFIRADEAGKRVSIGTGRLIPGSGKNLRLKHGRPWPAMWRQKCPRSATPTPACPGDATKSGNPTYKCMETFHFQNGRVISSLKAALLEKGVDYLRKTGQAESPFFQAAPRRGFSSWRRSFPMRPFCPFKAPLSPIRAMPFFMATSGTPTG